MRFGTSEFPLERECCRVLSADGFQAEYVKGNRLSQDNAETI